MRALLIDRFAERPQSRIGDIAVLHPGPDSVRVGIEAAAINPLDAKIATGAMADWFPIGFPYAPGTDFAGIVEAVGDRVTDLAVGDHVFGRADPISGGAIADAIVIDASLVARRPLALSASHAACLPTPAGVAWQVLAMMERSHDEPVLVLGDGAVAHMAAALAGDAARRVTTLAALSDARNAHHAIDTVGGGLQRAALEQLPRGAHLIALTSPPDATLAEARGVRADFAVLESSRAQLEALAEAAVQGVLNPRIDHRIAFTDAAKTFDRYVAREIAGKIVIEGAR